MKDASISVIALHVHAANADDINLKSLLCHCPELVSSRGVHNATALHWACLNGSIRAKELECDVYSNLMYFDNTADYCSTIRLLHECGADMNSTMDGGITPLHLASAYGAIETVKALVELGSSISASDDNGNMPLDYAQRNHKEEIVDYYLSIGVKPATRLMNHDPQDKQFSHYVDNYISFTYPSDLILQKKGNESGYFLSTADEQCSVCIFTEPILVDAQVELIKKDVHCSTQERKPIEPVKFGDNDCFGLCIEDYSPKGKLSTKGFLLIIGSEIAVSINDFSGTKYGLSHFAKIFESIRIKQERNEKE